MKSAVHILNVGHGDSLVVEVEGKAGTVWGVIDCHNPDPSQDSPGLTFLKKRGVSYLEFVCITHPDLDHFSGMKQLLEYFSTGGRSTKTFFIFSFDPEIYRSVATSERKERAIQELYTLVLDLVRTDKLELQPVSYGTILVNEDPTVVRSLGPYGKDLASYVSAFRRAAKSKRPSTPTPTKNLLSVVVVLESNSVAMLLCSDATKKGIDYSIKKWSAERKKQNLAPHFHFIKVSHHGSKSNNHEGLWTDYTLGKSTSAAISSGSKKFNLPDLVCVESIVRANVNLYCTNIGGCLTKSSTSSSSTLSKQNISPLVRYGLDQISSAILPSDDIVPLHGNISFHVDDTGFRTNTEFPLAPITAIP